MNISLRLLFTALLIVSCTAIHAMDAVAEQEGDVELPLSQPTARMAAIKALARNLEASLASDAEYYQLAVYKYRTPNSENLKELAAKTDLVGPTQRTIKAILQLADAPNIDLSILENVISSIVPFKIKYVAASTNGLPKTAKAKKITPSGYEVEDHTNNFKDHMLCTLHGLSTKVHQVTMEHIV